MAHLGERASLTILREQSFGLFLDAGDELGEVLLPRREMPMKWQIGGEVEVFLYLDSEDRPVATMKHPKVMPGGFAYLECLQLTGVGAFLDWGLPKELLVPYREQTKPMIPGRHYIVKILIDEKSGRFIGSQRITRALISAAARFRDGDAVTALLWGKTELGYKAVVDGKYNGLFFSNQVFQKLEYGQTVTAYVTETRSDGKLDLSLTPVGRKKISPLATQFMEKLQLTGTLMLSDKSPAVTIKNQLNMSKKTFKQVVGQLYKQKKILIHEDRIMLA